MPPKSPTDLATLARQLLTDGPVRTLPTTKRLRVQLGGRFVADTTRGLYVWEHPYYPYYYLPLASFAADTWSVVNKVEGGAANVLRLSGGASSTERVLAFAEDVGGKDAAAPAVGEVDGGVREERKGKRAIEALRGMVRIEFGAADAWFEEDTRIDVHPKDPFKRIDIVHSQRPLKVFVGGKQVAHASSAYHLFETGLPTRYYIPPTSVDPAVLRPSQTKTKCPYKGEAEYYDVVVDGETAKDVVWFYRNPTQESALIVGALCFYNEKVDIELDGKRLERPKSIFAYQPDVFLILEEDENTEQFSFAIAPDAVYWLSLQAFNPDWERTASMYTHIHEKRAICPYLSIEFKKDPKDTTVMRKVLNQVTCSSVLGLYNRWKLRQDAVKARGRPWVKKMTSSYATLE